MIFSTRIWLLNCRSHRVGIVAPRVPHRSFGNSTTKYQMKDAKSQKRAFNFSAGPSCISDKVMCRAQNEFCSYQGSGMGIFEMSHRQHGGPVQNLIQELCTLIRKVLSVPNNYQVLLHAAGAHGQFAAVPLNLGAHSASYVNTGWWSERAMEEARKYCHVNIAFENAFAGAPPEQWKIQNKDDYVHICGNETIHGVEFPYDPELKANDPPLVADMTSTLFSRPIDISKYGIVYCSGGKNFGPTGMCLVLARNDLVYEKKESQYTPCVFNWRNFADAKPIPNSYNAPAVFSLYIAKLVMEEILDTGGVDWMAKRAKRRSKKIYDIINDSNGFYINRVHHQWRSRMNIPFTIQDGNTKLESLFIKEAVKAGLYGLEGHPASGGQRISLYNAIPDKAINGLIDFMLDFMARHKV